MYQNDQAFSSITGSIFSKILLVIVVSVCLGFIILRLYLPLFQKYQIPAAASLYADRLGKLRFQFLLSSRTLTNGHLIASGRVPNTLITFIFSLLYILFNLLYRISQLFLLKIPVVHLAYNPYYPLFSLLHLYKYIKFFFSFVKCVNVLNPLTSGYLLNNFFPCWYTLIKLNRIHVPYNIIHLKGIISASISLTFSKACWCSITLANVRWCFGTSVLDIPHKVVFQIWIII